MTAEPNNKSQRVRALIDQRLKAAAAAELVNVPAGMHIDEDTITAFVEGRLREDECQPVLSHLAACGMCRRASAQFVQLENQVDAAVAVESVTEEPGRLEAMLAKLSSAVPAHDEEVVFAYQDPDEEKQERQSVTKPDEPGES